MAESNPLEIVPEKLFQTHFISEIDHVQKKLQYEIERKKEELRAMVGERYRDLIHAADTIEEMKETTGSTLQHISEMMVACKNLHDTHLVGFKIDNRPQSFQVNRNPLNAMAVQVKLLMEIPEKIWKYIGENNFVKAAQLFILARHINTGLQLQIGGKNTKPGLQSLQRIVQQQWTSITNLSQTIIDLCGQKLQDVDINVEVSCSCLIALYILDSQTMVQLLNTLIEVHSNTSLKNTLQFDLDQILDGDVKAQIKKKIVNGVKIVLKTVELVHACFVENNGGEVLEKLKELYAPESQPLIELVQFSDSVALQYLPTVITKYRLSTNKEITGLAKSEVTASVQNWSTWVSGYISANVSALLHTVTRVRVLHEIREETFRIESPPNWDTICQSLNIPEVHVWSHYFQPLITARVKAIIDGRWDKLYDTFKTQLLIDLTKTDNVKKEANINWFVWKDLIGDTVIESRSEVVKVMNSLMKGMSHQDRGYTPNLEKLCTSLDEELQKLLEDVKEYLYPEKKKDKLIYTYEEDETENMYVDRAEIEQYLRDTSDRHIQSMLQYIRACFEEHTLKSTELQRKTTAIYTARFTQAITTLMPHFRKCYIGEDFDDGAVKSWNNVCGVLKNSCIECWRKWLDIVIVDIQALTAGLPQKFTLEANIDYLMMQWDVIKIEEKDDEGTAIESTIKVPIGPSLKLQEYLYSISRILDQVVPHTLPNEIHAAFIDNVTSISFAHYNKVVRENETDINQRCALQLLMDIRYMTLLMVPRENKKGIEFSQEICEFLRSKIDPFDYDVFYPYIQTNLKRSVQRVQTLLGSLVLQHSEVCGIVGGARGDRAAMLAPANPHWFTVLPVAAPLRHDRPMKKKQSPGPKKSEISELMTSSLPLNFASARSNAASFFNSMTSDWFSG
ncbi:conserved oligomeric Golgi complex subunit 1 [Aricia agestis]|uniref:conserved oligomeric Golgi complex subunit 1 n=1 Tax=Aricia agestis TaxID=91739 RepID=UPI001C201C86|nr:conserved oligomeric Golgi complex subunit 1 [Aricia agestis]